MTRVRPPKPHNATFAAYLRGAMERRRMTGQVLADRLGCTDTLVSYWRRGQYIPKLPMAERLAEVLNDARILDLVQRARVRHCGYLPCSRTFEPRNQKQIFCSEGCWKQTVKNPNARRDSRQDAIDAFCRACEPEGLCRIAECPLRAFSPLPFVPMVAA